MIFLYLVILGKEISQVCLIETYTRKSLVKGERFLRYMSVSATLFILSSISTLYTYHSFRYGLLLQQTNSLLLDEEWN